MDRKRTRDPEDDEEADARETKRPTTEAACAALRKASVLLQYHLAPVHTDEYHGILRRAFEDKGIVRPSVAGGSEAGVEDEPPEVQVFFLVLAGERKLLFGVPGAGLWGASLTIGVPTKKALWDVADSAPPHPAITVYKRQCVPHRRTYFYAGPGVLGYEYSGTLMPATPLPPVLEQLLAKINALMGSDYNGILCNVYNNGASYIGAHSDDFRALDPNVGVVAVVLVEGYGIERIFRIRDKSTSKIKFDVTGVGFGGDHLLHMEGEEFQDLYTHELPPMKRLTGPKKPGRRVSFTLRRHHMRAPQPI